MHFIVLFILQIQSIHKFSTWDFRILFFFFSIRISIFLPNLTLWLKKTPQKNHKEWDIWIWSSGENPTAGPLGPVEPLHCQKSPPNYQRGKSFRRNSLNQLARSVDGWAQSSPPFSRSCRTVGSSWSDRLPSPSPEASPPHTHPPLLSSTFPRFSHPGTCEKGECDVFMVVFLVVFGCLCPRRTLHVCSYNKMTWRLSFSVCYVMLQVKGHRDIPNESCSYNLATADRCSAATFRSVLSRLFHRKFMWLHVSYQPSRDHTRLYSSRVYSQ